MHALSPLAPRPAVAVRPSGGAFSCSHPRSRHSLPVQRALIGDVNDPEKSKQNAEKKKESSEWAEPSNKNPLEPRKVAHEGEDVAEEAAAVVDKVKDSVSRVAQQAREAVARLPQK